MAAMQADEAPLSAADESFLAGVDIDDFLFVLLDSLQPSLPGDPPAAATAGAAAAADTLYTAAATSPSQHNASALEGPPLLAALREAWRPDKLLPELLHHPPAAAGGKGGQQQQQDGEEQGLALHAVEIQLSCPLKSWGVIADGPQGGPLYASCLSAAASLLSYGETQGIRVALAIKAFLEVRPVTKEHQIALLLLLRLLVFRWALCHHLNLPRLIASRLGGPVKGPREIRGGPLYGASDAAETAATAESPAAATKETEGAAAAAAAAGATATAPAAVTGWLGRVVAFAVQEAAALGDGDERRELLLEVLQIAARCAPQVVISKLLKAAKKAGTVYIHQQQQQQQGCCCTQCAAAAGAIFEIPERLQGRRGGETTWGDCLLC